MMNRRTLDVAAVFFLFVYLEFNHLSIFGELYVVHGLYSSLSIITLVIPFIALMVRGIDCLSASSLRNRVDVRITKHSVTGRHVSDDATFSIANKFSTNSHFIGNENSLMQALHLVIKTLMKNRGIFSPAPYVVIMVPKQEVSEIEIRALVNSAEAAGAVKALIVDIMSCKQDVDEAVSHNPIENFA